MKILQNFDSSPNRYELKNACHSFLDKEVAYNSQNYTLFPRANNVPWSAAILFTLLSSILRKDSSMDRTLSFRETATPF